MPDVTTIQNYAVNTAQQYGIDPNVFLRLLNTESGFNPSAISSAGAIGVGQLMPGTAQQMGVTNLFDYQQNIQGSAKYLSSLLNRFGGNYPAAVAAYNAGPGRVTSFLNGTSGLPQETQNYVNQILGNVSDFFTPGGMAGGIADMVTGGSNNPFSALFHLGGKGVQQAASSGLASLLPIGIVVRIIAGLAGLILLTAAVFVLAGGTKYVKEVGKEVAKGAVLAS